MSARAESPAPVDLRSDTVTRPTPGMLQAMAQAPVGDDVFGEDPTMNAFEQKIAALFGKQAGLFVPSGTLSNQLCLHVLAGPGEEVLIDELGHIYNYETGAAAHLSSLQLRPLRGERGKLTPELVRAAIRPRNDWDPWSAVLALENTTNKGGGACYTREELLALRGLADAHGLAVHLDGARIWNAITATGVEPAFFGTVADTISVCFSKGLGAPVGSMMLADAERVKRARRMRKMWGGGMRQVGLLAAAADWAVEHHWPRLADDHRHAKAFAGHLSGLPGVTADPERVESNIVMFSLSDRDPQQVVDAFAAHGIRMVPFGGPTIRATFHFQVDDAMLARALEAADRVLGRG